MECFVVYGLIPAFQCRCGVDHLHSRFERGGPVKCCDCSFDEEEIGQVVRKQTFTGSVSLPCGPWVFL